MDRVPVHYRADASPAPSVQHGYLLSDEASFQSNPFARPSTYPTAVPSHSRGISKEMDTDRFHTFEMIHVHDDSKDPRQPNCH